MDNQQYPLQTYKFNTTEQDFGTRLDKFIAINCPDLSRSRIKVLIESGNLKCGQLIIKDCSLSVKQLVEYELTVPVATPSEMSATNMEIDVVYEDEFLAVINKPAGLTVHPGAGNYNDTLANGLLHKYGDSLSGIGGVQRPGIVHRLDKDTSGLMVIAKNDHAHRYLSKQLASRELSRTYIAIVWGMINPSTGAIKINMARSTRDRTKMSAVPSGGKEAVTNYKTLEIFQDGLVSKLECKLETGRTHQIRVHMSFKGHNLLGDPLYGSISPRYTHIRNRIKDFNRQALHSTQIGFIHPKTLEYMEFKADLPQDMQNLLGILKQKSE
jgi:23S rRNA pseudouridine1911/1915/1917 synthase